jgi:hypothetical protein
MTSLKAGDASDERASAVFINYRREDTAGHTGRLHDILRERFRGRIFMDIDTIGAGQDFVQAIDDAVGKCKVLLVMIGSQWVSLKDAAGGRRLDNPGDFVRREIAAALGRGVTVIPVLVEGAKMPREDELPDELKILSRHNAVELSDTRWGYDTEQLVKVLEKHVGPCEGAPAGGAKGFGAKWAVAALLAVAAVVGVFVIGRAFMSKPPPPEPKRPDEAVAKGPDTAVVNGQDEAVAASRKCVSASDDLLIFLQKLGTTVKSGQDPEFIEKETTVLRTRYGSACKEKWKNSLETWSKFMGEPAAVNASWEVAVTAVDDYHVCLDELFYEIGKDSSRGKMPTDKPDRCEALRDKASKSVSQLQTDIGNARAVKTP